VRDLTLTSISESLGVGEGGRKLAYWQRFIDVDDRYVDSTFAHGQSSDSNHELLIENLILFIEGIHNCCIPDRTDHGLG